jgi:multiple sugar transport system ATP-binding protein
MGRAIVRDPQVFLFDEPLSNLDAKLRVAMRAEIKGLHQRLKTTTVYVTHDQVEAMTMADKIVVMHDGIVEQVGEPLELYDRPRNMFVAGFIGSPAMNFVKGNLRTDAGKTVFVTEGGLSFAVGDLPGIAAGRSVTFGVRPEHLAITPDGIPAEVVVVEPTGSETQVNVRYGQQELVCLFRDRIRSRPGETIRVSPLAQHTHLFDTETGQRLAA